MAKRRSKARRRMPPRNAKGRFMKRGHARKRRHATRHAAPRRRRAVARKASPRRHYHRRKGRFVSERSAHYTPKYIARARRRKARRHLRAVHKIGPGTRVAGLVRLNPQEMMALANPRRRRRRRAMIHSRPRRHHRRHVARNPGFGGIVGVVKASVPMVAGGLAGGLASGLLDASLLAERPTAVRLGVKAAAAITAEALLRSKHPRVAAGLAGGLFGSLGYDAGLTAGGGMIAHTPKDALRKVSRRGLEDPEMAAMMGDIVDQQMLEDIATGTDDGSLRDIVDQIQGDMSGNRGQFGGHYGR